MYSRLKKRQKIRRDIFLPIFGRCTLVTKKPFMERTVDRFLGHLDCYQIHSYFLLGSSLLFFSVAMQKDDGKRAVVGLGAKRKRTLLLSLKQCRKVITFCHFPLAIKAFILGYDVDDRELQKYVCFPFQMYVVCSVLLFSLSKFIEEYDLVYRIYLLPYLLPMAHVGLMGSVYCTLALTIERFLAVCYPFLKHR